MDYKRKDRVVVHNLKGQPVSSGEVINVNEFREPELRYAVMMDGFDFGDDVVFVSEEQLKKENK